MGMDWLKGLVGASDGMVPAGQPLPTSPWGQQPQQSPGAPPQSYGPPPGYGGPQQGQQGGWGGQPAPQGYGAPPGGPQGQQGYGAPPGPQPSYGAPPGYGQQQGFGGPPAGGPPPAGFPQAGPQAGPGDAGQVAVLEARVAELRRDVDAIALFAKTLLALLEEKQVVTEQQFQETKRRLDMLDGKLDDK